MKFPYRVRRILRNRTARIIIPFVLGLLVFTCFLASEFLARLWLVQHPEASFIDYRMARPAPYQNSPYWSLEFMAEQKKIWGNFQSNDDGLLLPQDFAGKWYHFSNNVRFTTDNPLDAPYTVYLFGSSLTLNNEVPDEYTIASYLQRDLNQFTNTYKVVNLGMDTASVAQQFIRLKYITLKKGDMVVFYDGFVDTWTPFTDANKRQQMQLPGQVCNSLEPHFGTLALITVFCRWEESQYPDELRDNNYLQQLSIQYGTEFRDSLVKVDRYVRGKGASFFHVLQPVIWSRPLSAYELSTVNYFTSMDYINAAHTLYNGIETANAELKNYGVDALDLTHVLDVKRSQGQEFYLDDHHQNESANEIIAQNISGFVLVF